MKEELKNDLTNLKETVDQQYEVIKCLNETVKTLAGEFEEHIDDTQSQFAEIKTDLQTSKSSINANLSCVKTDLADLQSSVDSVNDTHQ